MKTENEVHVHTSRTGGYVTQVPDGRVFHDTEPETFIERMLKLRKQGFEVPVELITRAQEEIEA